MEDKFQHIQNVYEAWDAYVVSVKKPTFKAFAGEYLQSGAELTSMKLSSDQANLLVDLIDSFVNEASDRHGKALGLNGGEGGGEGAAMSDYIAELKKPLFTKDEIEEAVKTRGEAFANMTDEQIREALRNRAGLFQKLKQRLLSRHGNDFAEELAPYLPEAEMAEAKRLFAEHAQAPDAKDESKSAATAVEENRETHIRLVETQAVLARGRQAKMFAKMLDDEGRTTTGASDTAPQCLIKAFDGQLLSPDENIVRKLTAVAFLLIRMSEGADEEHDLPFLAVGAARCAYDWVTEYKSTYQLVTLASALDVLEPANGSESDKVRNIKGGVK